MGPLLTHKNLPDKDYKTAQASSENFFHTDAELQKRQQVCNDTFYL